MLFSIVSPRRLCRHAIAAAAFSLPPLITVGIAPASAASAPVASPLPAAMRALAGVRSYQSDDTMAQRGGAVSRVSVVVKRTPDGVAYHTTLTEQGAVNGPGTFGEMVMIGERLCVRTNRRARYVCRVDAASARRQRGDFEAMAGLSAIPTGATIARIAPRTIRGRLCDGYAFRVGGRRTDAGTASVYLARDTSLPCMATLEGGPGRATIAWSRYNDPTLSVPAIR